MNPCTDIKRLLVLYLDDELNRRERSRVDDHLERCDACLRRIDLLGPAVPRIPGPDVSTEELFSLRRSILLSALENGKGTSPGTDRQTPMGGTFFWLARLFVGAIPLPKALIWVLVASAVASFGSPGTIPHHLHPIPLFDGVDGIQSLFLDVN